MTTPSRLADMTLGRPLGLAAIPVLSDREFRADILAGVARGWRVSALFGVSSEVPDETDVFVLMADDEQNRLHIGRREPARDSFVSLTPECHQVHLFEREIAEQFGLTPEGHPWLKPVRLPGPRSFFRVEGDEVHEVSVGPVHAGIIEPGHFRFQCHGERVLHLEVALGYQHRGVEEALEGGPDRRSLALAETLAGDSTVAHATSYCQVVESLAGGRASARAQTLRGVALELERLANHVGDLGALAGDVGFLPTSSYCGRLRGEYLNMTALVCGNRFGRGLIVPGGVGFTLEETRATDLLGRLATAERETAAAVNLLWENQSVMARFEDTGPLGRQAVIDGGIVGPAARAAGVARDVRYNQPSGIYRLAQIPVSTAESGDVFARAYVRWLEIQQSTAFLRDQLGSWPAGADRLPLGALAPDSLTVAMNEGWRGEVCHVAITDKNGRFRRYKVIDPSFHNWSGLATAMHNQEISDFPLCNKSFNLSYCGHDL